MRDRYYSEGTLLAILVHISRWAVGIIFIVAAAPKIVDAESFMRIIANYNILPIYLVPAAAIILPWLELICGMCLIMKKFVQSASAILSLLIVVFIAGLAVNFIRGSNFDCGCFGILFQNSEAGAMTIARDVFLLGLTSLILALSGRKSTVIKSR